MRLLDKLTKKIFVPEKKFFCKFDIYEIYIVHLIIVDYAINKKNIGISNIGNSK